MGREVSRRSLLKGAALGMAAAGLGSDMGMGGTITVRVTVDGDKLADVEIVQADETVGIGSRAVEELPAAILEAQTWDVDAVAGATVSSTAIKNAVKLCMEQAGLA